MIQLQMQIYRNIMQRVFEGKFGENLQETKTFQEVLTLQPAAHLFEKLERHFENSYV